jgi:hypothetical protein
MANETPRRLLLATIIAGGTVAAFVMLGDLRLTPISLVTAFVLWLVLFFVMTPARQDRDQ